MHWIKICVNNKKADLVSNDKKGKRSMGSLMLQNKNREDNEHIYTLTTDELAAI